VVNCYLRNSLLLQPLSTCDDSKLKEIANNSTQSANPASQDPNFLRLASSGARFPLLATTSVFPLPPSLAKLDVAVMPGTPLGLGSSAAGAMMTPDHLDSPMRNDEGGGLGAVLGSFFG